MQTPEKPIVGSLTVSQALEKAFEHHSQGNLVEAERLYEAVLRVEAEDVDALHLLGVVRKQQRRYDEAIDLIGAALQRDPDYVQAYINLGVTLADVKRYDEALASYAKALAIDPSCVEAHYNNGVLLST